MTQPVWRYWNPHLVNGKNALLKEKKIPDNALLVCRQKEYRSFSIYFPFYTFIQESYQMKPEDRNFFEYILGGQAQKPYFDLDIDLEESKFSDWDLLRAKEAVKNLVKSIVEVAPTITGTTETNTIKEEDIMVFSSHGKTKISFHIIVDRWCFQDYISNKFFCEKVISNMMPHLSEAVDKAVYTNGRQMRMYMSTKYQKGRIKILDEELSKWKPLVPLSKNPAKRYYQISYASFITITSNCKIIGYKIPEGSTKRNYTEQDDLPDKAVDVIKETIDCISNGTFSVLNVTTHRIDLKRNMSSTCVICHQDPESKHDNENAFLTVSAGGYIFYHCRRADPKIKVPLGNIDVSLLEIKVEYSGIDLDIDEPQQENIRDFHEQSIEDIKPVVSVPWKGTSINNSPKKSRNLTGISLYKSMTKAKTPDIAPLKTPERRYLFEKK